VHFIHSEYIVSEKENVGHYFLSNPRVIDSNDPTALFGTARGLGLSATFLCFNPKFVIGVETAI
jgi:hypothetical protein